MNQSSLQVPCCASGEVKCGSIPHHNSSFPWLASWVEVLFCAAVGQDKMAYVPSCFTVRFRFCVRRRLLLVHLLRVIGNFYGGPLNVALHARELSSRKKLQHDIFNLASPAELYLRGGRVWLVWGRHREPSTYWGPRATQATMDSTQRWVGPRCGDVQQPALICGCGERIACTTAHSERRSSEMNRNLVVVRGL